MSDQNDSSAGAAGAQPNDPAQPQLRIDRIFLKDASFESPSAPEVFLRQWRPELKLDINTQANRVSENQHQVVLTITVTAQLEGDMVGFIVEVQQGGLFHIEGIEDNQLAQVLGIACPTTLFPYLRESIDGLVVKIVNKSQNVEYKLSEFGNSVIPIISALKKWSLGRKKEISKIVNI